jgi:hypothetical protein
MTTAAAEVASRPVEPVEEDRSEHPPELHEAKLLTNRVTTLASDACVRREGRDSPTRDACKTRPPALGARLQGGFPELLQALDADLQRRCEPRLFAASSKRRMADGSRVRFSEEQGADLTEALDRQDVLLAQPNSRLIPDV